MRLLAQIALSLVCLLPAFSQNHSLDKEKSAAMLETAAKEGVPVPAKTTTLGSTDKSSVTSQTKSTVQNSVGVTAVLLTQPAVRRIFGKEIANTYAVVQVTISNKSPDAAFEVHSAYIDTSQWALGGGTKGFSTDGVQKSGDASEAARSGSHSNRIASVESRIARGQMLDAQQWSARNWTVRLLTLAGSIASGYTFAFKETGIAKGIAAFNGDFVPGVAIAWPDGSVAQQNRISDFGYQTNKVIAKQSADIIVCFFPIDMFLSPPFSQIFLKKPALFLSPYQVLFSDENEDVRKLMGLEDQTKLKCLQKLHACYSKIFEPQPDKTTSTGVSYYKTSDKDSSACAEQQTLPGKPPCETHLEVDSKGGPDESASQSKTLLETAREEIYSGCSEILKANPEGLIALDYIGRFGIQNIGVYVDGIMTVDVDTVPASIDQVTFDGDTSKPDFWTTPGDKTGSVKCRFCEGGTVNIAESETLGIRVKTTNDDSDNQTLKFSFTTKDPIPPGQTLTFTVSKNPASSKSNTQTVKSSPFVYTVGYAAAITDVSVKDKAVTVTGTGFVDTKADPLTVALHSDGKDKDVDVTLPDGQTADKLTFDVPSDLAPGCWTVQVKVGSKEATQPKNPQQILSEPSPQITAATRGTSSITVKGEQLVDTHSCGGKALTFQLQQAAPAKGAAPKPVDVTAKLSPPSSATLALPAAAKTGSWMVQLLEAGKVVSSTSLK
jgi:predicted secreted protein